MSRAVLADALRLARTPGVGPLAYRRLLERHGTAAAAIAALPEMARAAGRATPPRVPSAAEAEREIAGVAALGGRMTALGEPDYPPLLAALADPPPVLSVLGELAALSAPAVAVIGSRNASANGARLAARLAAELAAAGYVVVSGLARGIDTAAHEGALGAGRTVAAIAGGLDRPYPPENAPLQQRIAAAGAVVAEAPLGTTPQARHFPRRNRVIAGLALGTVVVEAALRSGSLITARLALEAGRELFAVPGSPLDPRAHGANDLIRQGAHLTEGVADVLANLPRHAVPGGALRSPAAAAPFAGFPDGAGGPEHCRDVLALLGPAPTTVDDIVRRCQFSASVVLATLLQLEIAGHVEALPGNRYALVADQGSEGSGRPPGAA